MRDFSYPQLFKYLNKRTSHFARQNFLGKILFFFSMTFLIQAQTEGTLVISETPVTIIQGEESLLNQPEGVVFSPSSDCIVVTNALGNTVGMYQRIGNSGSNYEITPSFVLEDDNNFHYPHDSKFSANGKRLAVCSRSNDRILFYNKSGETPCSFRKKPFYILKGSSSKLSHPASLDISSSFATLAVCNRRGSIAFYKAKGDSSGKFHQKPYQQITQAQLLEWGISNPHGIAFFPDGMAVATVHKKYFVNPSPEGQSALVIFDRVSYTDLKFNPIPSFVSYQGTRGLHSIAIHPSGKYFAFTDGISKVEIYQKSEDLNTFVPSQTIDLPGENPGDEGPKGVAFSPDGSSLAVTLVSPYAVLIYSVEEQF